MSERTYSVAEIDRMRAAIEHRWLFGSRISNMKPGVGMSSCSYNEAEKTESVEAMLRTYMLAGTEPGDLE